MKNNYFLILFVLLNSFGLAAQTCQITSPVAGSSWVIGSPMLIQWNTSAFTTNVDLVLIDYTAGGSGVVALSIAANIPNSGTYNWVIPNTLSPKCVYGVYVQNVGKTNWCYGPSDICINRSNPCTNLVTNGDFETSTTITSSYTSNCVCALNTYCVSTNANLKCSNLFDWFAQSDLGAVRAAAAAAGLAEARPATWRRASPVRESSRTRSPSSAWVRFTSSSQDISLAQRSAAAAAE